MRRPPEPGRRWMAQAEHNLEVARHHVESGWWSDACFMAGQAALASLKAYLLARGRNSAPAYSIADLARECSHTQSTFQRPVEKANILDKYYMVTRYPDALPPPLVPFEVFTEGEAMQALDIAESIIGMAKEFMGE